MIVRLQQLPRDRRFLDELGKLSPEGRAYFNGLEERVPFYGDEIPEGVVAAMRGATYYNLAAPTGSIHYVKTVDSIGGDRRMGWVLA